MLSARWSAGISSVAIGLVLVLLGTVPAWALTREASGSGFIVSPDGYILTNYHVVEGATEVEVWLQDGTTLKATVVDYSPTWDAGGQDIALLKVAASHLAALPLGDSSGVGLYEEIVVIGYPLTFALGVALNASGGHVTSFRELPGWPKVFQIDAAVNHGNSGGPLLDESGRGIGIVTSGYVQLNEEDVQGVNFAVPINYARDLIARNSIVLPAAVPAPVGRSLQEMVMTAAPSVVYIRVQKTVPLSELLPTEIAGYDKTDLFQQVPTGSPSFGTESFSPLMVIDLDCSALGPFERLDWAPGLVRLDCPPGTPFVVLKSVEPIPSDHPASTAQPLGYNFSILVADLPADARAAASAAHAQERDMKCYNVVGEFSCSLGDQELTVPVGFAVFDGSTIPDDGFSPPPDEKTSLKVGCALRATTGLVLGSLCVVVSLTWSHYLAADQICHGGCEVSNHLFRRTGTFLIDSGAYSWSGACVDFSYTQSRMTLTSAWSQTGETILDTSTKRLVCLTDFESEFKRVLDAAISALVGGL